MADLRASVEQSLPNPDCGVRLRRQNGARREDLGGRGERLQAGGHEDAPDVGAEALLAFPATAAHRQAALEPRDQTLDAGAKAVQSSAYAAVAAGLLSVDAAALGEGDALHAPVFERGDIFV